MLNVEGFILVGGKSSRMGEDKSRLLFDGQTSVARIAAELHAAMSQVSLVGSGPESPIPGLKLVPDLQANWGALGGIHAALSACLAEWALIVACDTPFVTRDLFLRLQKISQHESPDAVVPIQPDGPAEVELAVDPYFPNTIPSLDASLRGRAVHMGGRNRVFLDAHVKYFRDLRTQ